MIKKNPGKSAIFSSCLSMTKKYFILTVLVVLVGCASAGRDFPSNRVAEIQTGKTTKTEVRSIFGSPWRVGLEDGQQTWTYGKYKYKLIGDSDTKDLVIRFNAKDIVASYSFNTTDHQE